MPQFTYGQQVFDWRFQLEPQLKRHYVTVERGFPVLLRGAEIPPEQQEALIRQRARWICAKLEQVNKPLVAKAIATGSRLLYSGRSYYTEVRHVPGIQKPCIRFTAARFVIECPDSEQITPERLAPLLEGFYREKAQEKLQARLRYWEKQTGLQSNGARIRVFQSRWASCDANNVIEFHPRVMELPLAVQDYIVVHELCHVVEKSHTKAFWSLVAQYMPDWQARHHILDSAGMAGEI